MDYPATRLNLKQLVVDSLIRPRQYEPGTDLYGLLPRPLVRVTAVRLHEVWAVSSVSPFVAQLGQLSSL